MKIMVMSRDGSKQTSVPDDWTDAIIRLLIKQFRTPVERLADVELFIQIRPLLSSGCFAITANVKNYLILISDSLDDVEFNITLIHELKHLSWFLIHPYIMREGNLTGNMFHPKFKGAFRRSENAAIRAEKKLGHLRLINLGQLR
ncbi:MAG: hypothetical protein HY506_00840, partial [Candidatus Yanofskybacteria bacterium]|nr:hypothetical protein [Candidatus Yanofskybacteria bacterium]